VTQVLTAPRERTRKTGALARHADLFTNAGSLMGTTVVTSGLGFVYWWLAARSATPEAVGQASAAVAAMTLIGTIGMFGMGTMLISELPRMTTRRWNLISTCLLLAGSAATVGGLGYVLLASVAVPGLRGALGPPAATVLLVFGITLNAITLVLDEAMIGLLAGPLQLLRNVYFAVGKLLLLGLLVLLPVTITGSQLLLTWVAGAVLSVALLSFAVRRRRMVSSLRPIPAMLRGKARLAFDHNLLNMALYLPRASLPLVVTAVLTTRDTAAFYTAYMVMAFVAMIPANIALTLFAVASGDRAALRSKVRMGLLISFGLGVPASLVLVFAAHPIMSIFGAEYAVTAGDTLALLALAYVPMVFQQFFLAISRVLGRVRRAGALYVLAGLIEVAAAIYGGTRGSLTELMLWLVAVFVLEGVLMAPTVLRVAFSRLAPTPGAPAEQSAP